MADKVLYGIIGFGPVGETHCRRAAEHGFELVAVYEPRPGRAKAAQEFGARIFDQLAPMLEMKTMELTLLSTPAPTRVEMAVQALSSGKHVLLDTPFAGNLHETTRIVEAARRHNRLLAAFCAHLFEADYLTLRRILETGLLGEVRRVERRLTIHGPGGSDAAIEEPPREDPQHGNHPGGTSMARCACAGDQFLRLVPSEVDLVFADAGISGSPRDGAGSARASIRFRNGASGLVEVYPDPSPGLPPWSLEGDKGRLTLLSDRGRFLLRTASAEYEFRMQADESSRIYTNLREAIRCGADLLVKPPGILQLTRLLDGLVDSARIREVIRW